MTTACDHKGKVRFLACSCADRYPGMFVCDGCNETFRFDPSGKYSVRFLPYPNPTVLWKTIELKSSGP